MEIYVVQSSRVDLSGKVSTRKLSLNLMRSKGQSNMVLRKYEWWSPKMGRSFNWVISHVHFDFYQKLQAKICLKCVLEHMLTNTKWQWKSIAFPSSRLACPRAFEVANYGIVSLNEFASSKMYHEKCVEFFVLFQVAYKYTWKSTLLRSCRLCRQIMYVFESKLFICNRDCLYE